MNLLRQALGLAFGAILAVTAQATPITYTFTGVANGQTTETTFTDQLLTVVLKGDTTNIVLGQLGTNTLSIHSGLTNTLTLGNWLSSQSPGQIFGCSTTVR